MYCVFKCCFAKMKNQHQEWHLPGWIILVKLISPKEKSNLEGHYQNIHDFVDNFFMTFFAKKSYFRAWLHDYMIFFWIYSDSSAFFWDSGPVHIWRYTGCLKKKRPLVENCKIWLLFCQTTSGETHTISSVAYLDHVGAILTLVHLQGYSFGPTI